MTAPLAGKRILVVEDEYFIASDLKKTLEAAGAEVVGPTGDAAKGLDFVVRDGIQAALLDVNLGKADSYPIADRLAAEGVPFVFVTGYDGWALPPQHRDVPRLTKPYAVSDIVACLDRLIGDRGNTA